MGPTGLFTGKFNAHPSASCRADLTATVNSLAVEINADYRRDAQILEFACKTSAGLARAAIPPLIRGLIVKTTTKVRARSRHPELAKPEYARVYWHHGRYHYRSAEGRPLIVLGNDIGSVCFMGKLAIAKQADKAWRAYIQRKLGGLWPEA